jgi:hypothetical protein
LALRGRADVSCSLGIQERLSSGSVVATAGRASSPARAWLVAPKDVTGTASRLTSALVKRIHARETQSVAGADMAAQLVQQLQRYVHIADERVYLLVTLWVMGSYLHSMFSHYGYLFLHSKQLRSGKTRFLEVLTT